MALELNYKHQMTVGVLNNNAVISHLRSVLNTYVNNPAYSRFYIGITSDLETRRASHARNKPHFKMMCPIYEESNPKSDMAFHSLERDAINALRKGLVNPSDPSKKMRCENVPGGSFPKNWLYVLIG
jgi:hypothetical protein